MWESDRTVKKTRKGNLRIRAFHARQEYNPPLSPSYLTYTHTKHVAIFILKCGWCTMHNDFDFHREIAIALAVYKPLFRNVTTCLLFFFSCHAITYRCPQNLAEATRFWCSCASLAFWNIGTASLSNNLITRKLLCTSTNWHGVTVYEKRSTLQGHILHST